VSDRVHPPQQDSWRSLVSWLGLLLLVHVVVIGATVVVVRAQPPEAAPFLVPPQGCADPCWQGIQPGVTGITSAQSLLRRARINFKPPTIGVMGTIPVRTPRGWLDLHLNSGFGGFRADNTISSLCLVDNAEPPAGLLLGEVLAALGTPDEIRLRRPDQARVRVMLRYRSRQIEAAIVLPFDGARLTPLTPVNMLCFLPIRMFSANRAGSSDLVLDWRGASSILRYYGG
jgi:hypothetical protein